MKDLIIVGAGGLGREVLQMCMEINGIEKRWNIKGFIDDGKKDFGDIKCDYPILGTIDCWQPKPEETFVIAIADPGTKKKIVEKLLARGAEFETVISPRVFVATTARIGNGVVVSPFCYISDNTIISEFTFFNVCSLIGHDAIIGKYTSIMGHVEITGNCKVGEGCYFGSGARALPGSKIGDNAFVGAGSVVLRKVKAGDRVFGVPAMSFID